MGTGRYSDVEPLTPRHALAEFDCASEAQTTWLRRHAVQAHASGTSRVYVVRRLADDQVIGFHALASGAVLPADASERLVKGVGAHPIPVVVLTRLGVDRSEEGRGLGRALVVDALRRVAAAADVIGVRALLIHAENEDARRFYLRLAAFESSPADPRHLILLLKDLRRALSD